jgi:site-specific DNA recombinase
LERQQARLLEVYLAAIIGREEFERKHQEVTQTQHGLAQQLRQLDLQAQQQVDGAALAQGIKAFCHRIRPTLDHLTFAQRRQLVTLLIDRAIVSDGQVEIRYVVPTGPKGETVPFCHLRLDYFNLLAATVEVQAKEKIDWVLRAHPATLTLSCHQRWPDPNTSTRSPPTESLPRAASPAAHSKE